MAPLRLSKLLTGNQQPVNIANQQRKITVDSIIAACMIRRLTGQWVGRARDEFSVYCGQIGKNRFVFSLCTVNLDKAIKTHADK